MKTKSILHNRINFKAYTFLALFAFSFLSYNLEAEDVIILDTDTLINAEKYIKNPKTAKKNISLEAKTKTTPKETSTTKAVKAKNTDKTKVEELQKKLQKTQARLHLAEAESRRLNKLLKTEYNVNLKSYGKKDQKETTTKKQLVKNTQRKTYANINKLKTSNRENFSVATVNVEKANLRAGPGKNNSPIMTVSKGTRLAIETRLDDWYRVITPTGTRAWILSDLISFGRKYRSKPDRIINMRGYDKNAL